MTQRLAEIREAVADGAMEIDIVITRAHGEKAKRRYVSAASCIAPPVLDKKLPPLFLLRMCMCAETNTRVYTTFKLWPTGSSL